MHDWNEYEDERGVHFFWKARDDGALDVSIRGADSLFAITFVLTVDHIAWMYKGSQDAAAQWIAQHTDDASPVGPSSTSWLTAPQGARSQAH